MLISSGTCPVEHISLTLSPSGGGGDEGVGGGGVSGGTSSSIGPEVAASGLVEGVAACVCVCVGGGGGGGGGGHNSILCYLNVYI